MPDHSEIICWTEEPELISTISKKDKKEIIKAIGDANEVHGESFPTLSPIPEDEPLESGPQRRRRQEEEKDDQDTITDQNIQQVAGEEDTHEAEEANEEPDVDNSDGNHHRQTSYRPLNKNETYRLLMRTVGILPPKISRNCFAEATASLTSQTG